MDDDIDNEDQRYEELSSLEAIFPEIEKPDDKDPFTFRIELPVQPAKPVTVSFPAASNPGVPAAPQAEHAAARIDSHDLSHLPSVVLHVSLPDGYPADKPPVISISTSPAWLSPGTRSRLEDDGLRLWGEIGRNQVAFTYIDHVQQAAETVFDMVGSDGVLEVDPLHKIAILDYDIKARRAAFERETFNCGVCLDPKKGSACHKMVDCGHIFCIQCLQDFYNNAITEGDLISVRCLAPDCAKDRAKLRTGSGKKRRKPKTFVSPSELLQMGLSQDTVTRYVTLKYKTELESDKNTIYCPRSWCEGAARSKNHKRPEGLEFSEPSDEGSDEEDDEEEDAEHDVDTEGKTKKTKAYNTGDLIAICEACGFAFCSRCYQSWHGEFVRCSPRRNKDEISEEEQASIDYLKLHTTPCPTCDAPAQKTHGCNHMICFRCNTHFCYLCSAWLDSSNPYQHFNEQPNGKVTSCYMRLWELEAGDGADVDHGFAGGARQVQQEEPEPVEVVNIVPEIEEPDDGEESEPEDEGEQRDGAGQQGDHEQVGFAREGPLVLRIAGNPAPRGGRRPVPPAAPPAPVRPAGRNHGGNRAPERGRGNRGLGARMARRQNQPPLRNQAQDARQLPIIAMEEDGGELDPQQAEWVRNFVRMALNDEEGDSDEDWE